MENWRMPLRSFFISLSICDGSIEKLKEFMRISDLKNPTILDYDFNTKKKSQNENLLKCMISLTHNTKTPPLKDFSPVFNRHSFLRELWKNHKEFINEYIIRMLQIEILNFHGIKGGSLKGKDCYRRFVFHFPNVSLQFKAFSFFVCFIFNLSQKNCSIFHSFHFQCISFEKI